MKKRIIAFLSAVLLLFLLPSALALDDDEYSGYAADTLTVKVGYFGGPYYDKHVFTLGELWGMDIVYADYTFIDNMPSVVIDHVAGVRLSDIMDAAGIDLNSIETFYFWTRDRQSDYYTSYSKAGLIDTPRYCFYSLPDNYDEEEGVGNEYATDYGEIIPTVLALADDWTRTIAGATFGSDYTNLNQNTRFRLIFGQTDAVTRTANRSAKWIHEIVVELGGAPTLTLDASVLEGEVGSVLRTEPSIEGEPTVVENLQIEWSSSDESIAAVDENGNITVVGEGEAVITATAGGASASVTVNGKPGEETPAAPPPGTGEEGPPPETTTEQAPPKEPESEPEPVQETPTEEPPPVEEPPEVTEAETPGNIQLMKPVTILQRDTGGIQNWREEDMSETAQELPNIEVKPELLGLMGKASGALFLGSIAVYTALFYKNVGGRKRK